MTRYQVTSLPGTTLAQYTARVDSAEQMGATVGPLFGRLLQALAALGQSTDQPALAWYAGGAGGAAEIGVGVPGGFDLGGSGLQVGRLPAVERAAVVRYQGPLEGLGEAWRHLHEEMAADGLTPVGPSREVYLAGEVSRPDLWTVDLQQPLAGA